MSLLCSKMPSAGTQSPGGFRAFETTFEENNSFNHVCQAFISFAKLFILASFLWEKAPILFSISYFFHAIFYLLFR